jgi:hypothetical protein
MKILYLLTVLEFEIDRYKVLELAVTDVIPTHCKSILASLISEFL